jgi:hypothetical protein
LISHVSCVFLNGRAELLARDQKQDFKSRSPAGEDGCRLLIRVENSRTLDESGATKVGKRKEE